MGFVSTLGRDLRFAIRQMRQTPVVSGVALLSLALGIGANVAIFSLVNALMLKALPVHDPEQLVLLGYADTRGPSTSFTNPQWEYIRDNQKALVGVAASGGFRFNLNAGGEARPATGMFVSGRYLDVLGVVPILGRGFTPADDKRGGGDDGPVVILNYGFWQREYGGRADALGKSIALDGHPFTIIGVTPQDFFGVIVGSTFDVMTPFANEAIIRGKESSLDSRSSWWINVIGRLSPGQTTEAAQAQMRAFQPSLRAATMPQDWRPQDQAQYITDPMVTIPAATGITYLRDRYSRPLFILFGIVSLVLLIACANMANLLLAQSISRRREMAVRLSLGAGRWQLVRQLLLESVMLSLAGAAAGLLVAGWGSRALVGMLSTRTNTVRLDLSLDWRVFAFTAGVGVVTGLLFGVAPAFRGTRLSPADALRDHSRGVVSGGGRFNLGHALVALQVALSFVLVFGSTLFVRTLVGLTSQQMGFESSRVLVGSVDLRRLNLLENPERLQAYEQIRQVLDATPGIEVAAVSFVTPVSGSIWNMRVTVPGYDAPEDQRSSLFNGISPDYFKTLGTPIIAGRDFSLADTAASAKVMIINEAFAKKFYAGQDPIGKTFTIERFSADHKDVQYEVVGMVADAKYRSLREKPQETMYGVLAQQKNVATSARIAVKTATAPPMSARATIVDAIGHVNKEIVINTIKPFEEDVNAAVIQERMIASLSAFFGVLALLLAALGLYGVMSYSVTRRTNEIGIRMALGAEPERVVKLVLTNVIFITAVGMIVGAAASVGTGRFINTLLYNLAASDTTMIAITAITLAVAAAVAGYLPARRASRIDPMAALREQ